MLCEARHAVSCPKCQATNRDGASFCRRCGHLLLATCPRCRAPLLDDPDFCDNCGLALSPRAQFTWLGSGGAPAGADRPPASAPYPIAPATAITSEPAARGPRAANAQLAQYVPQELPNKLKS